MSEPRWQKSSFSTGDPNQDCVEIARAPQGGEVWLRESEEPGTVLVTTPGRLAALLRHLVG
jgi:hypothetical protein